MFCVGANVRFSSLRLHLLSRVKSCFGGLSSVACHDLNFYELIIHLTSKPDLSHTIKAENICETYTFCLVLFLATYKVCKRI